jgi:hypothetical protein
MRARINYVQSDDEAHQRLEDEEASALRTIPEAMQTMIPDLATRLMTG